jgi:HNH endonuclease
LLGCPGIAEEFVGDEMPIIIKCDPSNVGADGIFVSDTVWIVDECDLIPGDEAFVWWTAKAASDDGLAMHGNLVEVEHKPTKRGWPGASLIVQIDAKRSDRLLTKESLTPYSYDRTIAAPELLGPLPKLWRKLLNNSWQKVAALESDEAEYLRGFFNLREGNAKLPPDRKNDLDKLLDVAADEGVIAFDDPIDRRTQRLVDYDLSIAAIEGLTEEKKVKLRLRVAKLAQAYIRDRTLRGLLTCESCGFDPIKKVQGTAVKPRSLLDVHHRNPLDAGVRQTTLQDFCLLCPNCHRFEHAMLLS